MMKRSTMPRSTKPLTRTAMVKRTPKRRAGHDKAWLDTGPADRHIKAARFDWALTRWTAIRDARVFA